MPLPNISVKNKIKIGSLTALLFILFALPRLEGMINLYITQAMHSQGGLIRILMNIIPALLFLVYRDRIAKNSYEKSVIFLASLFSFLLFIIAFKFSTVADRLGLYITPIQMFVFNRLPKVFKRDSRFIIIFGIILYYMAVLMVWLIFGRHADDWIPYKFGLFEILEQ